MKIEPVTRLSLTAAMVGLIAGAFCIGFDATTQVVQHLTIRQFAGVPAERAIGEASLIDAWLPDCVTAFSPIKLWVVVTLGGLASGLIVYRFCPDAAGAGTDAAVDAFHNHKGKISGRVPWVKTIASAITLGTGGSAGREGPIAQIGAGVGSWVADRMHLSTRERRILLAAGMGAGVGAMFRAPLAGAIFAAEILYSDADMEADVVVPSAIASIVAYSVYSQSLPEAVRFQPIFGGGLSHRLDSPLELIGYMMLGGVMIVMAALYSKIFHATHQTFQRLSVSPHLRPMIGAALAATIGVAAIVGLGPIVDGGDAMTGTLGTGYGVLQSALSSQNDQPTGDVPAAMPLGIGVLVAVGLLKMLTSSLSIGSGGAGGVFGPSMVIGGCLGAAFGQVLHAIAPQWVPHPGAYAVVGMAGFFSGVARAPISTIIMIRELTGDFALIVPTMFVAALTFLASRRWTLYRKQVPTRLESPAHRGDFFVDVLEGLVVADVYPKDRPLTMVPESATLDEIVHGLASSNQHYFPVMDAKGKMVGIFSDNDVRAYLFDSTLWRLANAGDVMTVSFESVSPNENLGSAMQKFTSQNLDELPVIDPANPGTLLGFLRRKETIAAYNRRLMEHHRTVGE